MRLVRFKNAGLTQGAVNGKTGRLLGRSYVHRQRHWLRIGGAGRLHHKNQATDERERERERD